MIEIWNRLKQFPTIVFLGGECKANQISLNDVCTDCGAGEIPNTKKDACEKCPSEEITEDGIVCKACTGEQVPNGDQTACEEKGIHKK